MAEVATEQVTEKEAIIKEQEKEIELLKSQIIECKANVNTQKVELEARIKALTNEIEKKQTFTEKTINDKTKENDTIKEKIIEKEKEINRVNKLLEKSKESNEKIIRETTEENKKESEKKR